MFREETQGLREVSKDLLEASKNVEKLTLQIQSNHEKHSRLKGAVNSIERQIRKINTVSPGLLLQWFLFSITFFRHCFITMF